MLYCACTKWKRIFVEADFMKSTLKKTVAAWLACVIVLVGSFTGIACALAETGEPADEDVIVIGDEEEEIVIGGEEEEEIVVGDETPAPAEPTPEPTPPRAFSFGISGGESDGENVMKPSSSVFLVSFLANDDTPYFISEVKEGEKVEIPDYTPELEGYTFEYWFDIYGNEWTPYNFNKPVKKDLFLRAMFIRDALPEDMEDGSVEEGDVIHEGGGVQTHDVINFVLGLEYTISLDDEEIIIDEDGNASYADDSSALSIVVVENPDEASGEAAEDEEIVVDGEEGDEEIVVDGEEGDEEIVIDGEEGDEEIVIDGEEGDEEIVVDGEEGDEEIVVDGEEGDEEIVVDGEEGAAEPSAEPTEEAEPAPTATPRPLPPLENCRVQVFSSHDTWIVEGDVIEVWGELSGFDGYTLKFQWQYNNGNGWTDVVGATNLRYAFVATADTVNYNWRLAVEIYTGEEAAEPGI